jgi:RNA polymerase sigma-70 factor (family 1)
VYRIAYSFFKSQVVAEELVQEIFLKVWQNRARLPGVNDFQDWLFIVSRNHIVSHLRQTVKDKRLRQVWAHEHALYENSTDYRLREHTFNDLLQEIIEALPAQQLAVFRLAREEHLTYQEIAERLSISAGTVRTHMGRALQFIRQELSQRGIALTLMSLLKIF